ncbi:substrate-binding periplasmic protein [Teredinibacter haidensis]|uniref:substrate-binding periplasmic protein n=1 Tax=Teredinibacter haidensis TaxID=2731755 RepID=UPI000948C630|nr:transporter substrate-binding domain-containing protein [Teredinibacter haidensis]
MRKYKTGLPRTSTQTRLKLIAGLIIVLQSPFSLSEKEFATKKIGAHPIIVRHIAVPEDRVYDRRSRYFVELLELVLSKTDVPFQLKSIPTPAVPSSRNIKYMQEGRFDVTWMHTSNEREKTLRPIRIPIFRGLSGWRLFFVQDKNYRMFSAITSISTLKALKAVQGHDWPDIAVLKENQFQVRASFGWNGAFNMLVNERADYFPRGLMEIWDEMEKLNNHFIRAGDDPSAAIAIDSHLALVYPTAFYLYVSPSNPELANSIETGFLKAYADGSFETLFKQYFSDDISKSNLKDRILFAVPNPNLPPDTPIDNKSLWFNMTNGW